MAARICTRCGLTQAGTLRHCQRCSLALQAAGVAAAGLRPAPLVPALQQPGPAAPVQRAAHTGAPRPVVAAAAAGRARPVEAGGHGTMRGRPVERPRAVKVLAWVSASLLGASSLLVLARTAVPPDAASSLAAWLQAPTEEAAGEPVAGEAAALEPAQLSAAQDQAGAQAAVAGQDTTAPAAPTAATTDPAEATDHAALQAALQDALDAAGLVSVKVQLRDDGVATLRGVLPAGVERQMVQQWLASQDGVLRVIDQTRMASPGAGTANRHTARANAQDGGDEDEDHEAPAEPPTAWRSGDGTVTRSQTQTQRRSDGVQESTTSTTVRITRELR